MKIEINYDRYEYVTREASDANDPYDRDSTAADICINGIRVVSDCYSDIDVPFDVVPGETYYLVWADYETGDSFGYDNNRVEFIDLFKSKELAEECASIARAVKGYTYIFKRENGQDCTQSVPWTGYFESLNAINVEPVSVV